MKTVSLANDSPSLDSVFGALSPSQDVDIRAVLAKVDELLVALALHWGEVQAGTEGTGLDLIRARKGPGTIQSFLEPLSEGKPGKGVMFSVELRPHELATTSEAASRWSVHAKIHADCQEPTNCGHMHLVWDSASTSHDEPLIAAKALLDLAKEMSALARKAPLRHWLDLAMSQREGAP